MHNHLMSYIVELGLVGDNILFDRALIHSTFSDLALEELDQGEQGFERAADALHILAKLGSVEENRDFISRLPRALQELLCFHYFQLLERHHGTEAQLVH